MTNLTPEERLAQLSARRTNNATANPAPTTARKRHPALGSRIAAVGFGTSLTIGIVAALTAASAPGDATAETVAIELPSASMTADQPLAATTPTAAPFISPEPVPILLTVPTTAVPATTVPPAVVPAPAATKTQSTSAATPSPTAPPVTAAPATAAPATTPPATAAPAAAPATPSSGS